MKRKILTVAILIFIIILSACGDSEEETDDTTSHKVIPVETAEVKKGDLVTKNELFGQTQPFKQTPVVISQPGELIELKVVNGNKVDKGDALAVVESTIPAQPAPPVAPAPPAPSEAEGQEALEGQPTEGAPASGQEEAPAPEPEEPEDEIVEETIEAPSNGTVASLSQSTGTFVTGDAPLMMLIDLTKIKVQAKTTQQTRTLFKRDQEVNVEINDKTYTGKVLEIDPLPNENGEFILNVSVDNSDGKINSGEVAQITLERKLKEDVLIVPSEAVITTEDESYVYTIKDSRAKKVTVEVLETQTDETAIKGDIKEKEKIVIKGQSLLSNNINVEDQTAIKEEQDKKEQEEKDKEKEEDKADEKDGN